MKRRRFLATLLAAGAVDPQLLGAQGGYAMRPFASNSLAAIKSRYANRPFVLAFWSIHCAPCLDDMATWRSLRERFPEVPILLVSTDPPAEQSDLQQVLSRFPPGNVETWAFVDDFAERTRYAVDRGWRGELPRTYFYDRSHAFEALSGRVDLQTASAWFVRMR